jgi:hypothetical protein
MAIRFIPGKARTPEPRIRRFLMEQEESMPQDFEDLWDKAFTEGMHSAKECRYNSKNPVVIPKWVFFDPRLEKAFWKGYDSWNR